MLAHLKTVQIATKECRSCSEKVQSVEGPPVGNKAALQGHTETVGQPGVNSGQTLNKLYFFHYVTWISLTMVFLSTNQLYFSNYVNYISLNWRG